VRKIGPRRPQDGRKPGGRELRRDLQDRLRQELAGRGFRRQRGEPGFVHEELAEPPLQVLLLSDAETDKYGRVRLSGFVEVTSPAVDDLLGSRVPVDALTRTQAVYHDDLRHPLASASFGEVDGVPRQAPLEWVAEYPEEADAALSGFLGHLDGPVRRWIEAHRTVEQLRATVDPDGAEVGHGDLVRNVSALDALSGDLAAAEARLRWYREHPSQDDSTERVDAFSAWLRQAARAAPPS
jgi:hypothetical protein